MKKTVCLVLTIFSLLAANAIKSPYFSGYTGILGNFTSDTATTEFAPEFNNQVFFAGQFDFGGRLFLRGELSVITDDILESGLFEDTASAFKINEFSLTYNMSSVNTSHFITLFLGNYEPIGSDVFLQRQFGIQPITSKITENWYALCGSTVYPFYGMGGSYVVHFESPAALGLYAFSNWDSENSENVFNADARFAMAYSNFALDFSAGLAFPHEKEITETGQNVVVLVRTVTIHSGLNLMIGNKKTFSFFAQAGFSDMKCDPQSEHLLSVKSKDMYFFFEPRLVTRFFNINLSLFSIPQDSINDMIYLKDTLGICLSLYNDHLTIQNVDVTFGIHSIFSWPERNFMDFFDEHNKTILDWKRNLYIIPYASMPLLGGTLKGSVSVNCLGIAELGFAAVQATFGYRTQL